MKRKHIINLKIFAAITVIALAVTMVIHFNGEKPKAESSENQEVKYNYPYYLLELYKKNPETKEFVFNYPKLKDRKFQIDLSKEAQSETVPLLFQWDTRWGYAEYAGGMMGLNGCGPTCLSMVALYVTHNKEYTPLYIASVSTDNGYCRDGDGTFWTLMSEGAKYFEMKSYEIPLDKNRIKRELLSGNPIICIMGAGDFTTSGHYIVMTDWQDGKIKINDPNSKARSETLWEYEKICSQIRNMWKFIRND